VKWVLPILKYHQMRIGNLSAFEAQSFRIEPLVEGRPCGMGEVRHCVERCEPGPIQICPV